MIGTASEAFLFIVCAVCLIIFVASVSGCTTTAGTNNAQPKNGFIKIEKSKL